MNQDFLRYRQVHLDFHTHGAIEGIGADFDPDEFAETLKRAHVDSINIFARGHHGYLYYESKKFPERRHPHLTRNLLADQIEACHKRGIQVPVYITVQWDAFTCEEHPEWVGCGPDGKIANGHYDPGFYANLCVNTPYMDFLKEMVTDLFDCVPVDGTWFDIVVPRDCSCKWCRKEMIEKGLNPADEKVRKRFAGEMLSRFKREMTKHVRSHSKDCIIFYNSGHVGPAMRPDIPQYTHLELESLPSGGWGYLHFPVTARYARTVGADYLGMTGKFHTSWGDFHSFKNEPALAYECFMMLALNAKCCVGDQLQPRGKICPWTYELIGSVYEEVEKAEPWCRGAKPVADIGVITPEAFMSNVHIGLPGAIMGATRILQETHHQFDILDAEADFSAYKLLILPDEIPVDAALAAKLQAYLQGGGKLIASFRSGLNPEGDAFALPLGVTWEGDAEFQPMFVKPREVMQAGLNPTEYVMYQKGAKVSAAPGTEVLADAIAPYFNRTWEHYCSHQHAPASGQSAGPAIVRQGNVIYIAQPIFGQYQNCAPSWCRQLVVNAVDQLLADRAVITGGPSTLLAALNEQPAEKRLVLHLLHYVPVRNNDRIDTIDEVLPLYELPVSVRVPGKVKAVTCEPSGEGLSFTEADGRVNLVVPKLEGYQIVAIELEG